MKEGGRPAKWCSQRGWPCEEEAGEAWGGGGRGHTWLLLDLCLLQSPMSAQHGGLSVCRPPMQCLPAQTHGPRPAGEAHPHVLQEHPNQDPSQRRERVIVPRRHQDR